MLVAVDGTWRGARRMVASLPADVWRFAVPAHLLALETGGVAGPRDVETATEAAPTTSLLSRLRTFSGAPDAVCTAQAAVAALRACGHAPADCDHAIAMVRRKVETVAKWRAVPATRGATADRAAWYPRKRWDPTGKARESDVEVAG